MKNLKRVILASASTFLLAAGLVRAADKLDPVSRDLVNSNDQSVRSSVDCANLCAAVDCANLCHIADDIK